jgi:hypothetical protein
MGALEYAVVTFEEENVVRVKREGQAQEQQTRVIKQTQKADMSQGGTVTPFVHQIEGELNNSLRRITRSFISKADVFVPSLRCSGMSCDIDWILLVEKDTVYTKMAQAGFPQMNRCLLLTVNTKCPARYEIELR